MSIITNINVIINKYMSFAENHLIGNSVEKDEFRNNKLLVVKAQVKQ